MSEFEKWEQELQDVEPPKAEEAQVQAQAEKDFEAALQKAIDRRIRKICLKTIAIVAAVAVVVFLGVNPLMNLICPSPEELRGSGVSLTKYLRTYYETVQPYTEILEDPISIESRGFGRYTVHFQCLDHTGDIIVGRSNAAAEFAYGNYWITDGPGELTTLSLNRFSVEDRQETVMAQLRELPRSSKIYLSVTAAEPVEVQALRRETVSVNWVEIDADSTWRGGLSLGFRTSASGEDWRDQMDDAQLKQQYLENLSLLMAEPRLVAKMNFCVPAEDSLGGSILYDGRTVLQENYDAVAAQEGTLMTRRYSIYGSRDDILSYLEKTELKGINIEEVTLI